jgi:S-adenosylmethionine:tRNA ribosyltransferase-isomerase
MIDLNQFDYYLPKNQIAQKPAVPRDHSRIFVYDTKKDIIAFDYFYHLDRYLPLESFLVLNNTKVLPARVEMRKSLLRQGFGGQGGGKVVVLFLVNEIKEKGLIAALVDRKVIVGEKLFFQNGEWVRVEDQQGHIFTLRYHLTKEKLFDLLRRFGTMPVPLYLKNTPLARDQLLKKYQTVFAKEEGSAAAPTASLHFTNRVFNKLKQKGIKKYFVTLHVGLGTFAPITEENLMKKTLPQEHYEIAKSTWQTIEKERKMGKKLFAVGTTVVRTLESAAKTKKLFGQTDLFIFPPYRFLMIDGLITNFHLPKSSLMLLVEAFLRFKGSKKSLVELYNIAVNNDFRFYSFGDAMVII